MTSMIRQYLDSMASIHERLFTFVASLGPKELEKLSYCSEWDVASVLSHIGSGAEIFTATVAAAAGDGEAPGDEERKAIWARWDEKDAAAKARDAAVSDGTFLESLEELGEGRLAELSFDFGPVTFGGETVLGLLFGERVLHSWDVLVSFDDSVRLRPEDVNLLLRTLPTDAGRRGHGGSYGGPPEVAFNTLEPEAHFLLRVDGDSLSFSETAAGEGVGASVSLPSEALCRLVAGRLDDAHTPAEVTSEGVSLDQLRSLFPGY